MSIAFISAQELKSLLDAKQAILVDVRPNREHQQEHIQATHLALDEYLNLLKSSPIHQTSFKYIIYCTTAIRSLEYAQKLAQQHPDQNIYILQEGLNAWKNQALPIKKSKSFYLPISQQVQIAIGLILLLINMLAYFMGSAWFILTAIMGIGLCLAGLTGFCGLAILISKMPWNR